VFLIKESDEPQIVDVNKTGACSSGVVHIPKPGMYVFRRELPSKRFQIRRRYLCSSPIGISYPGTYKVEVTQVDCYQVSPVQINTNIKVIAMSKL
jgi:hypothetical protein